MVASRCNFSLSVCMCHSIASPLHPVHLFSSSILFSQNLNVPPPSSRLLSLFLAFFEPLEKGCFSAVQAKDKSPHTHTHAHTHLILWVLTTKWHTVWMLYLYVSVLCPWHFCNYLWVKKNIKMLRALVKCCTGSTKGGVGVLLASQTVIQTESWGDLRMRAARAYFTNLLCKPSAPRHARIRTRSHTRIQSGTVESTRGTCPYLTAPGHICANKHAHTHFHKAELGKGLSSSNTHLNT